MCHKNSCSVAHSAAQNKNGNDFTHSRASNHGRKISSVRRALLRLSLRVYYGTQLCLDVRGRKYFFDFEN
jgi:hypothetical protein